MTLKFFAAPETRPLSLAKLVLGWFVLGAVRLCGKLSECSQIALRFLLWSRLSITRAGEGVESRSIPNSSSARAFAPKRFSFNGFSL